MECIICGRRRMGKYCNFHTNAYRNLLNGFKKWEQTLGLNWHEYLKKVKENPKTGRWVVEVCNDLLEKKDSI